MGMSLWQAKRSHEEDTRGRPVDRHLLYVLGVCATDSLVVGRIDAIDQGANNAQADEYCPGVLEAAAGGMAAAAGVRWNQYLAGGTNGQTRIFGSGRIEIHVNPNHTIDLGVILIHEGLHAAQNGMSHSEIYSAAETCRQYLPPPPPP